MPDLDIITTAVCTSIFNFEYQVPNKPYTVKIGKGIDVQYELQCNCLGYRFRGQCRHIRQARTHYCGWVQAIHGGEPNLTIENGKPKKICPHCGANITYEKWGV